MHFSRSSVKILRQGLCWHLRFHLSGRYEPGLANMHEPTLYAGLQTRYGFAFMVKTVTSTLF